MKGKKADPIFVSNFITNCINSGIISAEEIMNKAQSSINEIDVLIQQIEEKKKTRSKLLDVVNSFQISNKNIDNDIYLLGLFNIHNFNICKYICNLLKVSSISISDLESSPFPKEEVFFCVKQMVDNNIIHKTDKNLLQGIKFSDYLSFVLKDNNDK